ncbi:MAG: hypothetical protein LBH86_08025 [Oscillospiraceae bacterium]|jgi:hypothetical protein|nr:hypothetical protein [Oscillospiraceae bacterium]
MCKKTVLTSCVLCFCAAVVLSACARINNPSSDYDDGSDYDDTQEQSNVDTEQSDCDDGSDYDDTQEQPNVGTENEVDDDNGGKDAGEEVNVKLQQYNGIVAILTEDTVLSSPYAVTINTDGADVMQTITSDITLSKNDIVVVIEEKDGVCRIRIAVTDLPGPRGYLDKTVLSYDTTLFTNGNQCILHEAVAYDNDGNAVEIIVDSSAHVVQRRDGKVLVSPMGYGREFWVDEADLSYDFHTEVMDIA